MRIETQILIHQGKEALHQNSAPLKRTSDRVTSQTTQRLSEFRRGAPQIGALSGGG